MINLGDKVRDTVTGFTGIAIARTLWLNGCARVTLQPPMGKDGKIPDATTFDEPQLVLVEAKQHEPLRKTGGPRPEVSRRRDPR